MYINVISFKNGKTLPFGSEIPFSVDKVVPGWNVITDERTGQILNFKGEEIVTIASAMIEDEASDKVEKMTKKPAIKTAITKG